MSSVFKTIPGKTIKGFAGKQYPVPFYLQFVPGYVVNVVHSEESFRYVGEKSINTIIALPHVTDKAYKARASTSEQNRYYPLLRGIQDVPSKGDPVLLCTIGKINYYLGPLNTTNNSPTWNTDPNLKPELSIRGGDKVGRRGSAGESKNFNKEFSYRRLVKKRKEGLDFGSSIRETTGDMLLEGRHGNSIRIGSRSNDPYVFISNSRSSTNNRESISDGSLISITSNGSLQQHFGDYQKIQGVSEQEKAARAAENNVVFGFSLASDTLESPNRFMGSLVSSVNNNQNTQELIYDYDGNQTLFNSDRITINTKLDDIYLSSIKDIHIGTGRHLTISTNQNFIVESEKTFLGNPTPNGQSKEMDSMVLGKKLQKVLKDILKIFSSAQYVNSGGPASLVPPSIEASVQQVEIDIDQILSSKHFLDE